jgi:hypothetical protein
MTGPPGAKALQALLEGHHATTCIRDGLPGYVEIFFHPHQEELRLGYTTACLLLQRSLIQAQTPHP